MPTKSKYIIHHSLVIKYIPGDCQFHPILDWKIFGLAHSPDIPSFNGMFENFSARIICYYNTTFDWDFKSLIVAAISEIQKIISKEHFYLLWVNKKCHTPQPFVPSSQHLKHDQWRSNQTVHVLDNLQWLLYMPCKIEETFCKLIFLRLIIF